MAVIVHPAHRPVPADDAVFRIVHLGLVALDLLLDGLGHGLKVVRVQHALEGVAGQRPELLPVLAAEDVVHRVVGVQQLAGLLLPVDEEATGHVLADLLDGRKVLAVQLKLFSKHSPHSSGMIIVL